MQGEFYSDSPLASKVSFGTGNRKRLRRELRPEYDFPTPIGTAVTWVERKTYKGAKRVYYRSGVIVGHFADANGIPRYEIELHWKTENKDGKIKLNTKSERAIPIANELELNKTDCDRASFGMIRHFGYSLGQLLETPNKYLKVNK